MQVVEVEKDLRRWRRDLGSDRSESGLHWGI